MTDPALHNGPSPARRRASTGMRTGDWVRALRIPFYTMTIAGFALGWAAAVSNAIVPQPLADGIDAAHPRHAVIFALLAALMIEAASALLNEVYDEAADRANRSAGPLTGGSRVIVSGALSALDLRWGARVALAGSACCAAGAAWALGDIRLILQGTVLYGAGLVLGIGYTAPPLRLVYRGLGEPTVALTHGSLIAAAGWLAGGRPLSDPELWRLGLPVTLAVFAAITIAGIPDSDGDRVAGKRTLAAILSPRAGAIIAACAGLAAFAFAAWFGPREAFPWSALVPAAVHVAVLIAALARVAAGSVPHAPLSGTLGLGLGLIFWFSAVPATALFLGVSSWP